MFLPFLKARLVSIFMSITKYGQKLKPIAQLRGHFLGLAKII
jgi:hypothetical protein